MSSVTSVRLYCQSFVSHFDTQLFLGNDECYTEPLSCRLQQGALIDMLLIDKISLIHFPFKIRNYCSTVRGQ
jgi:hypothetical protein